jgi:siroheme synthase (precorrin-2 oxidase/ferrochelatase)
MGSISSSLQSNGSGSGSSEGSKQSPDVPVLIIGGGPTGLLQANLLAQLGGTAMSL